LTLLARDSVSEIRLLAALSLLSIIVGMAAGLIGAAFRYSLERADAFRAVAVTATSDYPVLGPLMMVTGAALAAGLAAWLVRRFSPDAAGSGIPHVEAVLEGSLEPAPARLIPVKFVGGVLAMGSGLALGREGPSVQMGVTTAHVIGGLFRRNPEDRRALIAGGAGAGLATAFNAPGPERFSSSKNWWAASIRASHWWPSALRWVRSRSRAACWATRWISRFRTSRPVA
jgi:CIC family chloride channel protein